MAKILQKVGSFNFDLRSAFLNTEMGVICSEPAVLAELRDEIVRLSAPAAAYTLALDGRVLRWQRERGAKAALHEPEAPALRRGASWVIGHLPIHSFL
jgi:putative cardiolipin synthase